MVTKFSNIKNQQTRPALLHKFLGNVNKPWVHEMGDREDGAKNDTYAPDDYVGNTQERIAAAHDRSGANDDALGALVHVRGEPLFTVSAWWWW